MVLVFALDFDVFEPCGFLDDSAVEKREVEFGLVLGDVEMFKCEALEPVW